MKHTFKFLVCLAIVAILGSCGKKQESATLVEQEVPYSAYYTAQDTAEVMNLVNQFMDLIVAKNYNEAIDMLGDKYTEDSIYGLPCDLNDVQRQQALETFQDLNVTDYAIRDYTFKNRLENQVRINITLDGGINTKWYLRPVTAGGHWRLTLMDTQSGDLPIE